MESSISGDMRHDVLELEGFAQEPAESRGNLFSVEFPVYHDFYRVSANRV